MIIATVVIILLIIIGLTAKGRLGMTGIENKIGGLLSPIQKVFYNVGQRVSGTFQFVGDIGNLKEENSKLKKEIIKLKEENMKNEDIIRNSDILENEASLRKSSNFTFIEGQVIGKDPGKWFDRFVINKGSLDGINIGDAVVQGVKLDDETIVEGLVGRVLEVGDKWSKVITIIDEGSDLSFKVIRSQDGGIVSGSLSGEMNGYLFDDEGDIMEEDKLLTSGLGGVFTKDIYVGKVRAVEKKEDELIKKVVIEPAINFKNLSRVFVIKGNN